MLGFILLWIGYLLFHGWVQTILYFAIICGIAYGVNKCRDLYHQGKISKKWEHRSWLFLLYVFIPFDILVVALVFTMALNNDVNRAVCNFFINLFGLYD